MKCLKLIPIEANNLQVFPQLVLHIRSQTIEITTTCIGFALKLKVFFFSMMPLINCGFLFILFSASFIELLQFFFVNGYHYDNLAISDYYFYYYFYFKRLGCSLYTGVAYWQVNRVPLPFGKPSRTTLCQQFSAVIMLFCSKLNNQNSCKILEIPEITGTWPVC